MTFYLCVMLEGKAYYNSGDGQWITDRRHLRSFPSEAQAKQTRDASIFRESITIHEEYADATEEQPSANTGTK